MIEYPKICQVTSLAGGHTRLIYLQQPLLPREIQNSGLLLAFRIKQLITLDGLESKHFFFQHLKKSNGPLFLWLNS